MSRKIHFTKMHGLGNDYIYVNSTEYPIEDPSMTAMAWSDRHTGIGSDGLVLIGTSQVADFSMRIFNADGSEAKMCGNASRCIGKYVYDNGLTDKTEITLETLSGIRHLSLFPDNGFVRMVQVDMGIPIIANREQVDTPDGRLHEHDFHIDGKIYTGSYICMGNPHLVIFTSDAEAVDIAHIGPILEHNPLFPQRTNVEFASVREDGKIRMRVWERGSGVTQACGTGACATAVAAILTLRSNRKVTVVMDGGELLIHWDKSDEHVYMLGTATKVFDGSTEL